MFFITGDTHIPTDIHKLTTKQFPQQRTLTREDYVIICGDFGGLWQPGSPTDAYWLEWLERKPFTTLFIDGNHENFDMLNALPVEQWNGGKVHTVRNNIRHLMRGQVFRIKGTSFFTMGGGSSADKEWRTPYLSWWPEEMPSEKECTEARANLARVNNCVDYILTHTAPLALAQKYHDRSDEYPLNQFLTEVQASTQYKHWFFGHFHMDKPFDAKHTALYQTIYQL